MRSVGSGALSKSGLPEHFDASGIGVSAVCGLRSCASCSIAEQWRLSGLEGFVAAWQWQCNFCSACCWGVSKFFFFSKED